MLISRKKFLKISGGTIAGAALSSLWMPNLLKAASVKDGKGRLPIIWFHGQACTGCSVSLLNTEYPGIDEVLIEVITLDFHPSVMAGTGDVALDVVRRMIKDEKGQYILVVEGSIPLEAGGEYCTVGEVDDKPITALEWIEEIGSNALAVVAVGTCASWGGIPSATPSPTGAVPASEVIKDKPIINIPGCPPHPDWMVGTLVNVLKYGIPKLDEVGRPEMFFGNDKLVHDNCELRKYFDEGKYAKDFGDEGCLYELGCKGPVTHCDIATRGWNSGVNWCNRAGGPCVGCKETFFPGATGSGLYEKLPAAQVPGLANINANANTIGIALGAATAAGIGAHAIARVVSSKKLKNKNKNENLEDKEGN